MSFIKKIIKVAASIFLLPALLFFSVYSLDQQGFFKINKIDIQINSVASQKNYIEAQVKKIHEKLSSVKGISLWRAPLSQISDLLSKEMWIHEFQISRAWPSGISIQIVPDKIEILAPSSVEAKSESLMTELRPITTTGKVLDRVATSSAPNVVIARDPIFVQQKNIRQKAVELMRSLPASGGLSADKISEIGFDKREGYWVKLLHSETQVNFGDEQFEIKSARISQVIDYLESRNLQARVIDANLSKKVLVRLRQNP